MGKPAAKMGDKVVATDIHIVLMPSPSGTVPTPTPLPFTGTISTGLSTDVFIEGKAAAVVNSGAINTPVHIPPGGPFQKPPTNQGKILTGSTGVFINGKPAARSGDTAITCNDPVDAPVGNVVAVGTVFIGDTGTGAPAPPAKATTSPTLIKARWGQPGTIVSANWKDKKVKIGDEATLEAVTKDFDDGTPVKFVVWEQKDSQDTYITEMDTQIKGNKANATWKYLAKGTEIDLKEKHGEEGEPEYYFAVSIEGEEKRSEALKFKYPLDISLKDDSGNPIDDLEFTITFSDGTKKKGKFKQGAVHIDDAPYGKFTIEIKGSEFIFQ